MKIVQILGMKRNDKLARNEVARKIYFKDDWRYSFMRFIWFFLDDKILWNMCRPIQRLNTNLVNELLKYQLINTNP